MSSTDGVGYATLAQSRKILKQQKQLKRTPNSAANYQSKKASGLKTPANGKLLSDVLTNCCCSNDLKRANVSGRFISKIDIVDARFRNLESLLLGNNELSNVNGLEQFIYLRSLSLVNNPIEELEQIQILKQLHFLENLHLSGCLVTRRPNYVAFTATAIPALKKLDSIKITKQDREFAQIAVVHQKSMISIMVANETTIRIVQSLQRKIRIHLDLFQMAFGRVRIFNRSDFNPSVLHQMNLNEAVKILGFTQDSHRDEIRGEIMRRIEMMWRSLNEVNSDETSLELITRSWEFALSESMAIQQERLASAISSTEITRIDAQTRISMLLKRRQYPHREILRPTLQSMLKTKSSAKAAVSSSKPKKSVNFPNEPLISEPKREYPLSSDEPQTNHASHALSPGQSLLHEEEGRAQYQTLTNERQRISDLESLNKKLVQKLQQFQEQNRENVMQAESDARAASGQIGELTSTVKRLQHQADCYKADRDRYQIILSNSIDQASARQVFLDKIAELEHLLELSHQELTECQLSGSEQKRIIEEQQEKLRQLSLVQQFNPGFHVIKTQRLEESDYLDGAYLTVGYRRGLNQLRSTFRSWNSRIARKHGILRLRSMHGQRVIAQFWTRWRLSISCVWILKQFCIRRLFHHWRCLLASQTKRKRMWLSMLSYQDKHSVRCSWHHWRQIYVWQKQSRTSPETRAGRFYANSTMRSRFNRWHAHVIQVARPKKQKNLAAKYFRLIRCISKCWAAWKEALMAARIDCSQSDLARIHYQIKFQRRIFMRFHLHSRRLRRKKSLQQRASNFIIEKTLTRWHRIMKRHLYWSQIISERKSVWDSRRISVVFNCWLAHWRLIAKEVRVLQQTIELDRIRCLRRTYCCWHRNQRLSHAFHAICSAKIAFVKNQCFSQWLDNLLKHQHSRENRKQFVMKLHSVTTVLMMKEALKRMKYFSQRTMHLDFLSQIISNRQSWKTFRCFFHQWITSWLLNALINIRAVLRDANYKIQHLQAEREALTGDAVRYTDMVASLRDTVLQQSLAMANKDTELQRLQTVHDSLEDRIESLTENNDGLVRDLHTLDTKCRSVLNEKELLEIRVEELKDHLRKAELEGDEATKRQSNLLLTLETALNESMIALKSSSFRSVEKKWVQQLIRLLQHILFSSRNRLNARPDDLNIPVISNGPSDYHHRSLSEEGPLLK